MLLTQTIFPRRPANGSGVEVGFTPGDPDVSIAEKKMRPKTIATATAAQIKFRCISPPGTDSSR
jgi:hypothetical protein